MDLARSCYSTEALFFRDNATVATIKWYRAPEGAKTFPVAHKWGQLRWYSRPWEAEGVGEVYGASTPYYLGFTPPTARGQNFFGPIEFFQEGCEFSGSVNVTRDGWGLAVECTGIRQCFLVQEPAYEPLILQENGGGILLETCP